MKIRPEAIDATVQGVVAFGRQLLEQAPEQLLGVIERQVRALMSQQEELSGCGEQIEELKRQVKELEATAANGSIAPVRRDATKRVEPPKRSERKRSVALKSAAE